MKKCRKCGHKLRPIWKFCPMCGTFDKVVYPLRLVRKTDEPLWPEDWRIIRGLPWDETCRREIEDLYSSPEGSRYCIFPHEINMGFVKAGLCYRVISYRYDSMRGSRMHKIFKTVPKR